MCCSTGLSRVSSGVFPSLVVNVHAKIINPCVEVVREIAYTALIFPILVGRVVLKTAQLLAASIIVVGASFLITSIGITAAKVIDIAVLALMGIGTAMQLL